MAEKPYEYMRKLSLEIQTGLKKILDDLKIETHVGGLGRYYHVSWTNEALVDYRSRMTAAPRVPDYLHLAMLNRGICKTGILCAVTTREDAKKTLKAYEQSLTALKPVIREIAPHLIAS